MYWMVPKLTRDRDQEYATQYRRPSSYNPLHTFRLPMGENRQYKQQYADLYFLRLAKLKPAVVKVAKESWEGYNVR